MALCHHIWNNTVYPLYCTVCVCVVCTVQPIGAAYCVLSLAVLLVIEVDAVCVSSMHAVYTSSRCGEEVW